MTDVLKIVLVDDDQDCLDSTKDFLQLEGFEVHSFLSFKAMKKRLPLIKPDILVLDAILPGETAFEELPALRRENRFGLIVVSGHTEIEYRLKGLESGADAYLSKPADVRELKALILSLHNRINPVDDRIWLLHDTRFVLRSPKGTQLPLTDNEFVILNLLMAHTERPVERTKIMDTLGKNPDYLDEGSLYTLLSRLRKKCTSFDEDLPIRTVRNVGYVFYEQAQIVTGQDSRFG